MTRHHKCASTLLLGCIVLMTKQPTAADITAAWTQGISEDHTEYSAYLLTLLERLQLASSFENLVVYTYSHDKLHGFGKSLCTTRWSTLHVNEKSNFHYKSEFSRAAVVLLYIRRVNVLRHHFNVLPGLRRLRHLVFAYDKLGSVANTSLQARKLCTLFFSRDIYNVLLIFSQLRDTLYDCRKYPPNTNNYIVKYFNASGILYANQFLDMYGAEIVTHPDQLPPRTMLFYDERKQLQMGGYVGNLLTSYAQKRNATLKFRYPFEIGKIVFYQTLQEAARNGTLDIAASLVPTAKMSNFDEATIPYEISGYCYMVPIPPYMPNYKIFTGIVDTQILLAIFAFMLVFAVLMTYSTQGCFSRVNIVSILWLLNDKIIRGILGQVFTLHSKPTFNTRYIFFLLCYMSLLTNTMYQAYLQSFLIEPPRLAPVTSYTEMKVYGMKLLMPAREMDLFEKRDDYEDGFFEDGIETVEDYHEYMRRRAELNTQYVYPVSETRWQVFSEQQRLFKKPLFYYFSGDCLIRSMVLCLPIRANLPYRELFEDHMLRIQDSGLMNLWLSWNFYDMVRLNLTTMEDKSLEEGHGGPMQTKDFSLIFQLYLLCMTISILVFIGELLLHLKKGAVKTVRRKLKRTRNYTRKWFY